MISSTLEKHISTKIKRMQEKKVRLRAKELASKNTL